MPSGKHFAFVRRCNDGKLYKRLSFFINKDNATKRAPYAQCYFTVLITLFGCGGTKGAYSVTGKVTTVDCVPVTDGVVNFTSETRSASGALRADGTFSLGTQKEGDGLCRNYRVSFSGNCLEVDMKTSQLKFMQNTVNQTPQDSTFEVKAGSNSVR